MNMNFQRPETFQLERLQYDTELRKRSSGRLIVWSAVGVAAIFGLAKLSAAILVIVGGIIIAFLGLATAVCIYAQNNNPW